MLLNLRLPGKMAAVATFEGELIMLDEEWESVSAVGLTRGGEVRQKAR